ncbi:hypothetical protein HJG60_011876 [Phyllostomus discolor]|uniref:Uncharacterized protein n=1 Tax=Phyllostomus discolor TaxID=89673 RepID=A0A834DW13_9CHIR|nr:hypothetical protein HJG60_011876 [Phyllostomus discolor]
MELNPQGAVTQRQKGGLCRGEVGGSFSAQPVGSTSFHPRQFGRGPPSGPTHLPALFSILCTPGLCRDEGKASGSHGELQVQRLNCHFSRSWLLSLNTVRMWECHLGLWVSCSLLQEVPPSGQVLGFWWAPGPKVDFVLELKLSHHYGLDVVPS